MIPGAHASRSAPAAIALAALAVACDLPPRVGSRLPGGAYAAPATYEGITQLVMVPRCATAACHGGAMPVAFPELDAATWYDATLAVPSQQCATMSLVEPGDPERSYLVHKLRGTQGLVGGGGARMPVGDAPLDDAEEAALEAWIANGANP